MPVPAGGLLPLAFAGESNPGQRRDGPLDQFLPLQVRDSFRGDARGTPVRMDLAQIEAQFSFGHGPTIVVPAGDGEQTFELSRRPCTTAHFSCTGSARQLYRRAVQKPKRAKTPATFPSWQQVLDVVQPHLRAQTAGAALAQGNSLELLDALAEKFPDGCFDCIFADPPYFLSNGGITCHAGKMVKVDKGDWDKSKGAELNHEFNTEWLRRCQRVLKPNGTLWVTGTQHVIFSVGFAMQQLGMKILNDITWEKPNPPPNLSCRYFTHATETVLWAAKTEASKHQFNYKLMREHAGGKQMKSVWRFIQSPRKEEKIFGKHPTQKPVALVERCVLASTQPGDFVLDPFCGGGTTAVACLKTQRHSLGIELEAKHVEMSARRLEHASVPEPKLNGA